MILPRCEFIDGFGGKDRHLSWVPDETVLKIMRTEASTVAVNGTAFTRTALDEEKVDLEVGGAVR